MNRIAILLGASGLTGSHLLTWLLNDAYFDEVRALVRTPLTGVQPHPKLKQIIFDFTQSEGSYKHEITGASVVFCAVGTTNKEVEGDKDAYRKVDYDIAVKAAKAAAEAGVYTYVLVSSVGADANNNNNFYIKLKGVTEEAVCKEAIPKICIMRPSLLLGDRKEHRTAEGIVRAIAPVASIFMAGSFKKYKAIQAEDLAKAMLTAAKQEGKGIHIYEYPDLMKLSKGEEEQQNKK